MKHLVDTLRDSHHLNDEGYEALLTSDDAELLEHLRQEAQSVATSVFGHGIFVRGLIELTNVCRNDCYYCGIRRSNTALPRYILTHEQVMQSCQAGYELGFRTFVLQGGELPREKASWIAGLVADIRASWSDCAITLSLGEWERKDYELFRRAGADRYLLRHETVTPAHYALLHPSGMSLDNRLRCLNDLRDLGFQTGTGIMVGSPGQTVAHLVADIKFIERFEPQMIGLGPFIPQADTPLGKYPAGSADITTRLYSIFRLMFPHALIPSTTALNTLDPEGRVMGIHAGANVVMPNLTPAGERGLYTLYDGKSATDPAEGLARLEAQLAGIGYHIDWGRGDYRESTKTL